MNRNFEDDEMVKFITGTEFKDTGALWYINMLLHAFGMAITWNPKTDELKAALVKFRGFGEVNNDEGYKKLTEYMKNNAKELLKDCEFEALTSQYVIKNTYHIDNLNQKIKDLQNENENLLNDISRLESELLQYTDFI